MISKEMMAAEIEALINDVAITITTLARSLEQLRRRALASKYWIRSRLKKEKDGNSVTKSTKEDKK